MGNIYGEPRPAPGSFAPGQPHDPAYAAQPSEARQAILDQEHLRLLRIGYFISAGQTAFLIPFGLLYAGMGAFFSNMSMASKTGTPPPAEMMTLIFGVFGGAMACIATVATVMKLVTAMRLKQRRSRTLCLITAGFSCFEIPYGTALGVMTFSVLGRASVQRLFDSTH
jgi:hypothetical protein